MPLAFAAMKSIILHVRPSSLHPGPAAVVVLAAARGRGAVIHFHTTTIYLAAVCTACTLACAEARRHASAEIDHCMHAEIDHC